MVVFGFTYLLAAVIYAVVVLPVRMRDRAQGFAAGMSSPSLLSSRSLPLRSGLTMIAPPQGTR